MKYWFRKVKQHSVNASKFLLKEFRRRRKSFFMGKCLVGKWKSLNEKKEKFRVVQTSRSSSVFFLESRIRFTNRVGCVNIHGGLRFSLKRKYFSFKIQDSSFSSFASSIDHIKVLSSIIMSVLCVETLLFFLLFRKCYSKKKTKESERKLKCV